VIVVAIYNMKGGVGKSTTAVNLAYRAAESGGRTLLWDLDPQAASSFAFRVHPGVEGFGKKSLKQVDTLTEAIKATDYDNLDLLPADFAYRKLDRFLHRLGRPDRDLAGVLQKLGRGYTYVLLDCPPGLSTLSENVFAAADLILVPTIPTVLSLRTLSRLVEHVGHRGGNGTKLAAFLSMVDRRKALHRYICEWAAQYSEFFLPAQVPYASVIEQISVRRMPLAAVVPQDAAAAAFDTLWCNVRARLAEPAPAAASEPQRTAFAKATLDLIARLGGQADHDAVPDEPLPCTAWAADLHPCTHRIRLEVHGEDAFESLGLGLSADAPPSSTIRLAHIFDTDDGDLLRDGYLLQLLEVPGTFAVALETQSLSCGPASPHEEAPVATIDRRWAADILAGCLSPITVLERRLQPPLPKLISSVATAAGKQPLRRVTWQKHLSRRLGPILVPYDNARVTLHFEFDQISGPGSRVDYEIEATASGSDAHHCENAVRQIFSHAGINWQPLMVRRWPVLANGNNQHRT
jgi:cellulose biosynthesis protein BcsQ